MTTGRGTLTDDQLAELKTLIQDPAETRKIVDRVRMVLWWDEGLPAREIAELLGVSPPTARLWPARFAQFGVDGLEDAPRPGSPPVHSGRIQARILALTRQSPPGEYGVTHWSSRLLAHHLRRREGITVSHDFIARLWRETGIKPHRKGTFKLSKDPRFEEKVRDVVGLYHDPPEGAVVLSFDQKPQVQALERTQPPLPVTSGAEEKQTHDYTRHGTTDLFAALDVGTGEVTAACYDRHSHEEFLDFMGELVEKYTGKPLHVILDNLSVHKTPEVADWLAGHPEVTFHFTPTSGSWMNQVETWFGILTRQALRRGSFSSVRILIKAITDYVRQWNTDCKPFEWTATADEILDKVRMIQAQVRAISGTSIVA